MKCKYCGKETKNAHFCSRVCSGLYKAKLNNKKYPNKKPKREREILKCAWDECDVLVQKIKDNKKLKFCSTSCQCRWNNKYSKSCEKGGKKTRDLNVRRSKNEIHFAKLCQNSFKNVKTNESIFNGWDADVIIEDFKIAVMWDGIWHFKELSKINSLKKTQYKDKLRIEEIKKMGYIPYTIIDMGRENLQFVEEQFNIFLKYISQLTI